MGTDLTTIDAMKKLLLYSLISLNIFLISCNKREDNPTPNYESNYDLCVYHSFPFKGTVTDSLGLPIDNYILLYQWRWSRRDTIKNGNYSLGVTEVRSCKYPYILRDTIKIQLLDTNEVEVDVFSFPSDLLIEDVVVTINFQR